MGGINFLMRQSKEEQKEEKRRNFRRLKKGSLFGARIFSDRKRETHFFIVVEKIGLNLKVVELSEDNRKKFVFNKPYILSTKLHYNSIWVLNFLC